MAAHCVIVRTGKSQIQGTAWSLRPDLVVTAFHVVGNVNTRGWTHEAVGGCSYHLRLRRRRGGPGTGAV